MIKFFESSDAGAPTLNNAAGSMIAVLDACLITGYNSKPITSITVAAGVATVVCTAHGYSNGYGKIIRHAGTSDALLNIDARIDNVTTNGYTYLCPGAADGVATGTITAKYAPLDWVKQYSGTNKAMYKRSEVTATGCMLRIDDNAAGLVARALMVQSATDIDTYSNPAPLAAQVADGLGYYWSKGYNNATPAGWYLVSDGFNFYLLVKAGSAATTSLMHSFGDIIDFKPGSVLGCTIVGAPLGNLTSGHGYSATSGTGYVYHLISGNKSGGLTPQVMFLESRKAGYGIDAPTYPSDVDGGMLVNYPVLIKEGAIEAHFRGIQPGWGIPLSNISSAFADKQIISNLVGSPRSFLVAKCAIEPNGGAQYIGLIDLTGPWR